MSLSTVFNQIDIFVLILLRISGYIIVSPFWGRKEVQNIFKICFSIYFTYIIFISGRIAMPPEAIGLGQYFLVCLLEIAKGLMVGFLSTIFFTMFLMAGQLIDLHTGFQMGSILDHNYGIKVSQSAKLLNIGALIVFLLLNGHLQMINIVANSFTLSPIGSPILFDNLQSVILSAFSFSVLAAFKISLPIILVILFTNVILGVMVKFVPQLNIFAVGMPLKIIIGLFTLTFLVMPFINYLDPFFHSMFDFMSQLHS